MGSGTHEHGACQRSSAKRAPWHSRVQMAGDPAV